MRIMEAGEEDVGLVSEEFLFLQRFLYGLA